MSRQQVFFTMVSVVTYWVVVAMSTQERILSNSFLDQGVESTVDAEKVGPRQT